LIVWRFNPVRISKPGRLSRRVWWNGTRTGRGRREGTWKDGKKISGKYWDEKGNPLEWDPAHPHHARIQKAKESKATKLDLGSYRIPDLAPLASLTNLKELKLRENQITDVSPLAGLTKLEYLSLSHNKITNVMPLAGLTNLETLSITYNSITDLAPLVGLTNLKMLDLTTNRIIDLASLAGLTKLTKLHLRFNQITDVSPLAGLTKLEALVLANNPIPDDQIEVLRKALPNCSINFFETKERRPQPLPRQWVKWEANPAPFGGRGRLASMRRMEETKATRLSLVWGDISDATPLARLTNLTELNLPGNFISDVTPLTGLTKLKKLLIHGNVITDVTPLAKMTNLEVLYLTGNPIPPGQIRMLKKALPKCRISFSPPRP
jgi:internalin A